MILTKILSGSNFRLYNVDIARLTSVNASIVLGWLAYLSERHDSEEIFTSQNNISDFTGLSINEIKTAIKKLQNAKMINVTLKGVPAKNHYKLLDSNILSNLKSNSLVSGKSTNKIVENQLTSGLKSNQHIKNTNMNTNMNTNNNSDVGASPNRYNLFLSKFKDYELNLSKEIPNLIRHFLKKRWSEEQMDKTANEIHNHFLNMHTSFFDMALRECIDNNSVKIFFEDYSHLKDYELDCHFNQFVKEGIYV